MVSLAEIAVISLVNRFGSSATAAYGAVNQIVSYVQFPAISIGIGASIFGAQSIGARKFDRLRKIARAGIALNWAIGAVLIGLVYAFDRTILTLFVTDAGVIATAHELLEITLWSYVLFGTSSVLSGLMRSSGTVLWPTALSIISIWGVEVPVAYALAPHLGLRGVWIAYPVAFAVSLALQTFYYRVFWRRQKLTVLIESHQAEPVTTYVAEAPEPRLANVYPAHVVLVIMTLFPGLINTSAIALAAPVIGRDLGVAPDVAASIPLISDAALAFGCVLAAELTRRIEGRTLYFWLIGVSAATSLASALAPEFSILLAAHVVHGLVAGMLFIVVLPPLLTNFKSDKLGATAGVIVPCLFGAVTLGPLIGGLIAAPGMWRSVFVVEVAVAVAAMLLARSVIAKREPQGSDQPVDWYALIAAALGSLLVYIGIGGLAGNDWRDPFASIPLLAGLAVYAALIIGEARKEHPLVPVRKLATSLALVGTIATVIGSATFSALTQSFQLTLLRIDELDPRGTGFAFWPEFLTALAAGYVFGRLVTTKWVVVTGACGLVCIGAAAALARVSAPVDASSGRLAVFDRRLRRGAQRVAGIVLGDAVVRACAGGAGDRAAQPVPAHRRLHQRAGRRAHDRLARHDAVARARSGARTRARPTASCVPSSPAGRCRARESIEPLKQALLRGIDEAYTIVMILAIVGVAAIAVLLFVAHVPLRAPDLQKFDEGRPALQAPDLPG